MANTSTNSSVAYNGRPVVPLANPNHARGHLPSNFWSYVLFIINVKIYVFIKWLYVSPQIMLTIKPRMVSVVERVVQSILNTTLCGVHSWIHT